MQREFFARKASGLVRQISAKDALVLNVVNSAPTFAFMFIMFSAVLYQGVNMSLATVVAIPFTFLVALSYYFFAVTMPRSGGDYVWVSRSLHPAIGFMESFLWMAVLLSYFGPMGAWPLDPCFRSILVNWGTLTNTPAMIEQAGALVNTTNLFATSLIVTIIGCGIHFFSTKTLFRYYWVCFGLTAIGLLAYAIPMLATGHQGFVARFNELSGLNYSDIVSSAQSGGYFTGFAISGTMLGTVFAFLNLLGYQWATYVGGEVKDVSRSQMIACLGQVLICGLWTLIIYQVTYVVAGSEFINGASYLALTGNSVWTAPVPPALNYLVVFATDNPWIAALPAIGLAGAVLACSTSWVTMATRCIFAWSFDRAIPIGFSHVDQRFRAPRNAVALAFVVSLMYVFLNYFTGVLKYLAYGNLGSFIPVFIIGIAMMVFPFRRKDIFETAPKLVQTRVSGFPLMTILGAITTAVGAFISVFSVMPVFTGAPIEPAYILAIAVTAIIPLVIYGIAYWYNQRIGIDMSLGFREVPPA